MRRGVAAAVVFLSLVRIHAQDVDVQDAVKALLENALEIRVVARVVPPSLEQKPIWDMESTKLTIPGRSIAIQLVGNNVRIFAILTPYKSENDTILLVAQGQVWLTEPPEKEVRYLSTFRSIPITLGEKILFFPLGLTNEILEKDFFNIELEIQIMPYSEPGTE